MNLYEVNEAIRAVMNRVAENDGELTAEDMATLDALDMARADKLKAYAYVTAEARAAATGIKSEIDALSKKLRAQEHLADRLAETVFQDMKAHGETKAGDKIRGWRIQAGPPRVDVTDEKAIPASFWRQPAPVLVKDEIKDLLKSGGEVPGARLVQTEHIRLV